MRASEEEQTSTAGVSEVCAKFERIGWGPVRNSDHDLGTDLLVLARDPRRFDRGLIVGVQVKAGPSYFDRPLRENGETTGWWYREDGTEHFDDWVMHCLPHLVVLHDLDVNTSYWIHVTSDKVVSTGKGCKILIPKGQTIDREHLGELLVVAATQRVAPALEGAAFSEAGRAIPPGRRLRFALLVPRLVAPPRAVGYEDAIDAIEAVALLAQGRFRDLKAYAEKHPAVPDPEKATSASDWTWQLVAAIWDWAMTDSVEELNRVYESASELSRKAASGILLACALQRLEEYERATEVLERLLEQDDLRPADHGWALVQRARIRAEQGDLAGARSDAINSQRTFVADRNDITVSALVAAAAWQIYMTMDFGEGNLHEVLTASDTAVSWWRSNTISVGLQETAKRWFESWSENRARTIYVEDIGAVKLFSAELSADLTGEHGSWRAVSSLGARHRLMSYKPKSDNNHEQLVEGLDALRRSGDSNSLKLAIQYLQRAGPIEAVARAVSKVPLNGWTYTTSLANLQALELGGHLLQEHLATRLVLRIVRIADEDLERFMELVRGTLHVPLHAMKTIGGLLPAAEDEVHNDVARLIINQAERLQNVPFPDLQHVLDQLKLNQVGPLYQRELADIGRIEKSALGSAVLGRLASGGDSDARHRLVARVIEGDSYALSALGDLTMLENSDAASLITCLAGMTEETVAKAQKGSYSLGTSACEVLTLLNLWFPGEANWPPVLKLLCDPLVFAHDKRITGVRIIEQLHKVPETAQGEIAKCVSSVEQTRGDSFLGMEIGGLSVLLAIAIGALRNDHASTAAAKLAHGSDRERQDLALLLGLGHCSDLQPLLAALVSDQHSEVRRKAAYSVGRLLLTTPSRLLETLAWKLAKDHGIELPLALLGGMVRADTQLPAVGRAIAEHLLPHPSAWVRRQAGHLLQ